MPQKFKKSTFKNTHNRNVITTDGESGIFYSISNFIISDKYLSLTR